MTWHSSTSPGPSAPALAVAGAAAVATSFGMARYGYGLLLPDIQANLTLGAATLGLIGSLPRRQRRAGVPAVRQRRQRLPDELRWRVLATVNCGTGWGVAVAAPIAIVAGGAWRLTYLGFAAWAVLSTLFAARTLPGRAAAARSLPPTRRGRFPGGPCRWSLVRP